MTIENSPGSAMPRVSGNVVSVRSALVPVFSIQFGGLPPIIGAAVVALEHISRAGFKAIVVLFVRPDDSCFAADSHGNPEVVIGGPRRLRSVWPVESREPQ
ncbi:hypothetical protein QUF90_22140 [Desulfococcaceae bacterium HSG9]|nr:hypothetical protein [Desulfococcaceae bacterium HSG9]